MTTVKTRKNENEVIGFTSHSLWPWNPSWLSFFTAITMPVPALDALSELSSIQPLKTEPKPPSPSTLSGRKFLVAVLSSLKLILFKVVDCKISPSLRGVRGMEVDEALLLEPLPFFELNPAKKATRLTYITKDSLHNVVVNSYYKVINFHHSSPNQFRQNKTFKYSWFLYFYQIWKVPKTPSTKQMNWYKSSEIIASLKYIKQISTKNI